MRPCFARLFAVSLLAGAVSSAWAADAPAGVRFDISRFEFSGNTLVPPAALDAAVAPYTGHDRNFADVQRALEAAEAVFHAQGYKIVSLRLPEQELNGGVVRLEVMPGRIAHIVVKNNHYVDEANVRAALPTLVVGASPNLDRISANLKQANENQARHIKLNLQSADNDADVDAVLDVTDEKPWKAVLNLDNTGTGQTGKTHAGVLLQNANLWGRDHLASLQYTTTAEKPSQVSVYGAGYHIPLYERGDSVDLYASYSNVDSGSVTAGAFNLAVSGKGAVYGGRYNQSLVRSTDTESHLSYGLDVKAFKNAVLFAGENFGNDVTVHPLSLAYQRTDTTPAGETSLSATLVHNIGGGSHGADEDFRRVRVGAKAAYTMGRFAAAYTTNLGEKVQLRLLANGQLTGDALVPGEQFGAGGSASVRGFDERVLSADSGVIVNAELYGPNYCDSSNNSCRVLAFADSAYGKRNKVLAGEIDSTSISSVGLGVRLAWGTTASLQADWGHVVDAGATGVSGRNKVHVRISFAY